MKLLHKKISNFLSLRKILLALTLICLLIGATFVWLNNSFIKPTYTSKTTYLNQQNKQIYQIWLNRIKTVGLTQAYNQFKAENRKKPIAYQHRLSHLFGEAVYETSGINGIKVCDNSFNYGCYHSISAAAIVDQGPAVITQLNKYCIEGLGDEGSSCQHGIGHGVLTYYGHSLVGIKKALELCSTLTNLEPLGGCLGGVFMEYNFQTTLYFEGSDRKFDKSKPYFPCFDINQKYFDACMFQQTAWWFSVISGSTEEKVQQMDQLCSQISDLFSSKLCYKSIGNSITQALSWNWHKTQPLCKNILNHQNSILCQSGIVLSLQTKVEFRKEGYQLCNDLPSDEKEFCLNEIKQIGLSPKNFNSESTRVD